MHNSSNMKCELLMHNEITENEDFMSYLKIFNKADKSKILKDSR